MNNIPKTMKHTPISMSNAKISWGTKKWIIFINCLKGFVKNVIDMVGNFIILACKVAISSLVKVAKSVLYHTTKLETFVFVNYSLKRTEI